MKKVSKGMMDDFDLFTEIGVSPYPREEAQREIDTLLREHGLWSFLSDPNSWDWKNEQESVGTIGGVLPYRQKVLGGGQGLILVRDTFSPSLSFYGEAFLLIRGVIAPAFPGFARLIGYVLPKGTQALDKCSIVRRIHIDDGHSLSAEVVKILAGGMPTRFVQRQRGGRPEGDLSPNTLERYEEIADDYYDTQANYTAKCERPLTQKEFCEDRGISVRTLQRALKTYQQISAKETPG
ncbi:MAG: hypothetical protein ISS50_01410 [Anaerolineae bacterium]|nr:hypothetical protein [Anaerolineae bacterium]